MGVHFSYKLTGLPLVREKSGKFKVREKSGNFGIGQGNLTFCKKSGKIRKGQGNLPYSFHMLNIAGVHNMLYT